MRAFDQTAIAQPGGGKRHAQECQKCSKDLTDA